MRLIDQLCDVLMFSILYSLTTVTLYVCIGAHPVLRFHRVSSLSSCVLYARGCTGLWWAHAPLVGGRVTD